MVKSYLYIFFILQIGSDLQSSSSAIVDFTKIVDCCVVGEAVSCITENEHSGTENCLNALTPSKFPSLLQYIIRSVLQGNFYVQPRCNY